MRRLTKIFAAAAAFQLCLAIPLTISASGEAFARGYGGGGHFGGGHFGGFGGGHFGGGMHFGGAHFGRHFGGMHFGGARFGGRHFGTRGGFGHHKFGGNFAHGAHAFNHARFAHNAFGGRRGWNAWNRGYGNYGGYGYGWDGWAGPVFWPYFYGDVLSFALWPYDFYDPFFGYGPDYLFSGIFWPGALLGDDYAYGGAQNPYDIYGYADAGTSRRHSSRAAAQASNADAACAALAPGIGDLPIDRIKKAIEPNDTQVAILNDLKDASSKADTVLQASCPSQVPLTPVARLDAVGKRLDTMIQAVQILRAPLTTLYNSLDDQQRQRFDAIGLGKARKASTKEAAESDALGDLCQQQAKSFTNLPVQSIEQTIKPTDQQNDAFTALKNASAKAADRVASACPATMPQTLTDRFDAIAKRLDAMAGAVKTVEPALKDFYASLDDEQKARFNLMPPPPPNDSNTKQGAEEPRKS